jgi:PAS domain S-box-containing protein
MEKHTGMSAETREHELPEGVKSLIEAQTADAVFVVGPDYSIVHWDEQAESLTGILSEEVLGRRCYEVTLGESEGGNSFCTYGCAVMHLAAADRPVTNYDIRVRTRTGHKKWVNVSNLTVRSEEGPYLVHLLRDSQGTHATLEMARGLIQLSSKQRAPMADSGNAPAITPRQLEILKLLSEGKSVKEIKANLHLSEATVRNHIRSLLQALGAHSQLEVLAKAREVGLLTD